MGWEASSLTEVEPKLSFPSASSGMDAAESSPRRAPEVNLLATAQRPWLEDTAQLVAGALLYLDAGAGEAAASGVGLAALLGLGAANVCSLEAATR